MEFERAAAVSTGPDTHLDHLGVLAALLEIPLVVTDPKNFELAELYYPQVSTTLIEPGELTLDFLANNFDLLFGCGKYWYTELYSLIQLLYQKKMRFVLCPHGNSDKGSTFTTYPEQDIQLVYGEHMQELLTRTGAINQIQTRITTGNYRHPFYLKHQKFYDELAEKKLFCKFSKKRKTILYAPTWSSKENPTTFFETCKQVIEQLAPVYNLLIKPHPFLEEEQPAHLEFLQKNCENEPAVVFVTEFPPIYPVLAKTDIYIGDFSSVGYDFLIFDRPLYFLHPPTKTPPGPIQKAGITIPPNTDLLNFLSNTLQENQALNTRLPLWHHAFAPYSLDLLEQALTKEIKSGTHAGTGTGTKRKKN